MSQVIARFDASGRGTLVAHGGPGVYYGDGGPAIEAGVNGPSDLAFDGAGNVYFTEQGGHRVRRIDTNGIISTVLSGDNGLNTPSALDVDPAGNVYVIGPYSESVLKRAPSGRVTTLGLGAVKYPSGITVDAVGTVYVSQVNGPIVRIDRNGAVTNVFGGNDGFSGDGGPALSARHRSPGDRDRRRRQPVPRRHRQQPGAHGDHARAAGDEGAHLGLERLRPARERDPRRRPDAHRPLAGVSGVVEVAAGAYHSLALKEDGTVWAWGWNAYGQLGNGTTADAAPPVRVPGLTGVVSVSAGLLHSLAVKGDGTIWAWGWNYFGRWATARTPTACGPSRCAASPTS